MCVGGGGNVDVCLAPKSYRIEMTRTLFLVLSFLLLLRFYGPRAEIIDAPKVTASFQIQDIKH